MLQPRPVEVETYFEPDGGYGIHTARVTKRPFYTAWDRQATLQMYEAFRPEQLGYRLVDLDSLVYYYARPWPLWAVLRTRVKIRGGFWWLLRWMHTHGWFYLDRSEGVPFRWRDVRICRHV